MNSPFKKISYPQVLVLIAIFVVMVGANKLYFSSQENLYQVAFNKYQQEITHDIKRIISDRRDTSLSIALALAQNERIQDFLCEQCYPGEASQLNFTPLLDRLRLITNSGKIWIQVIDRKGVSRYRSWTDKVGDSLREVRYDVRRMLNSPSVMEGMSVGRYSLTFKAMAPLFDENQQLLGMVEVITHTGALTERLYNSRGLGSVVLVDKRFENQLTQADARRFIHGFYIANDDARNEDIDVLRQLSVEEITKFKPVREIGDLVLTQYLIEDALGRMMGYWFTVEDKSMVDLTEVRVLNKQYLYALIVVVLLVFLILWIYLLQNKAVTGRRYYRNILNATSEIIVVSDRSKIVDVNTRFFEFYSEYSSLKDFLQYHYCICDTFEPGEGLLQPEMNGQSWLDHILGQPDEQHIALIKRDDGDHYFQVKAALVADAEKPLYSIILHDVTKQTLYKQRLEKQAKTDPLTEIGNRLQFNKRLTEEISRAKRYEHELCLLIFDVDHFKLINDEFGHDVGNHVLITISHVVNTQLREIDVFCRIGGEEFAVIMPETKMEEARIVAERIRVIVAGLQEYQVPKQVTISVGLSQFDRLDSDVTLFKKTDTALYDAKNSGRNQVKSAS